MGKHKSIIRRGKHGRGGKQNGGKGEGWKPNEGLWNREYLAAFGKECSKVPAGDEMGEKEQQKIALLVGAKAEKLGIRPDKAGKLAARLCRDFEDVRVQLMQDLIENPGILESVKRVLAGEGDERNAGLIDEEAVEEAEGLEEAAGEGEAADA